MVSGELPSASGGLAPGSRIAGYLIEEQIGRGGMAVVYRASDPRLDRSVALKILAPELTGDAAFRQRFLREMRAAAAVDHPHIVPVFDAGEADGALYIAMRYVSGQDLRTLLDAERTLPAARVAHIVAQVASALDEAHSRGLIHRDVKPANVLIGTVAGTGQPDHVYLSDFGLSKPALSSANLTLTGQFLGTIDYMAPEQVEGHSIDGRADEYALACTTFEMLAGAPPFKRDQGLAVMWAQLSAAAPSLRAERPELSLAVDEVVAKALAKSPDDRYQTCTAFASALRAACRPAAAGGEPGPAAGPQAPGPATQRAHVPGSQASEPSTEPARVAFPPPAGPSAGRAQVPEPSAAGPATERSRIPESPAASAWPGDPQSRADTSWPGDPQSRADTSWPADPRPAPAASRPAPAPPGRATSWPPAPPPVTPARRPPGGTARPRRRGPRVAAIAACVALLAIAGVAFALLRGHSSPQPTNPTGPTSPAGSGHASSATSGPASTPAVLGPAATVTAYIAAINNHDYRKAWNLGGKNTGQSYNAFANGFAGTANDQLTIVSVADDVVTVQLAAAQTDGTVDDYHGTYTVVDGVITQSAIQRG
jgi:serine/threonine protein kinase